MKIPPGTEVINAVTGDKLADLIHHGDTFIVAPGGRGGRGNIAFASGKNPAPSIAENGEPGVEVEVKLQLKLMADVGFVGLPSVGKSTLLSIMTAAKPKIAGYHFTTLSPQLGVAETSDMRSFVLADLPGLIEGAHLGHGLGIQFLQHIERTKIIVHVIDMSGMEGRDPYDDYLTICEELRSYDPKLLERKQIIVANKMDMDASFDHLENFRSKLTDEIEVVETSGITQYGVNVLKLKIANILDELAAEEAAKPVVAEDENKTVIYTMDHAKQKGRRKNEFENVAMQVQRLDSHTYQINSPELEKLYKMTNMNYNDALMRFVSILRKAGVDEALRAAGAVDGDTIYLSDYVFEFVEESFENQI